MLPNDFGLSYYSFGSNDKNKVETGNHYIVDVFLQFMPYRYQTSAALNRGELYFWNPNKLGGVPQYCITYATNFDITNIVYLCFNFLTAWHLQIFLHLIIAAMSMFTLLKSYGISNRVSFVGGLAYSLNSMFICYLLYFYILGVFAWLPLVIFYYDKYCNLRKLKYLLISSIFLAISLLGGFLQSIGFVIILLFIYSLFKAGSINSRLSFLRMQESQEQPKKEIPAYAGMTIFRTFLKRNTGKFEFKKNILPIVVIISLAFILTAFLWFPTIEYIYYDISKGYSRFEGKSAMQYDFVKRMISTVFTISFFFPEIMGDYRGFDIRRILNSLPNDFNAYIGLPLMILFVFGVIRYKKYKLKHWIIIASISLIIPLFTPLFNYVYDRFFLLFITSTIIFSSFAFNDLLSSNNKNKSENLSILLKIVKVVFLVLFLVTIAVVTINIILFFKENDIIKLISDKLNNNISQRTFYEPEWYKNRIILTLNYYKLTNPVLVLTLFLNYITLAVFYLFANGKLKNNYFFWSVLIITSIQLYRTVHFWTPFVDAEKFPVYPKNNFIEKLQQTAGYERIAIFRNKTTQKLLPSNLQDMYNLQMIDGYEGLLPITFVDYLDCKAGGLTKDIRQNGLFSCRYIIADSSYLSNDSLNFKFREKAFYVFENKFSKNRAELIYKSKYDKNINLKKLIESRNFLGDTIILEEPGKIIDNKYHNFDTTFISEYNNNKIKIEYVTTDTAYLKLSDLYYAGWKAYIDGKQTKIFKVNGSMRAILALPGKHNVEFIFKPDSFKIGAIISLSFSLLYILVFIRLNKR
jgi:hypothetical protein